MRSYNAMLTGLLISTGAWAMGTVQDGLPDDYIPFTLSFSDSALVGPSEHVPGFMITMDLPGDCLLDGLDLEGLLACVREEQVTGTLTSPNGRNTPITYEIVRHRGPEEIYMKTTQGYFLWEYVSIDQENVHMAIYWWYCPPATPADLQALEMATELLTDPDHWHQKDDRDCTDDLESGQWSLFCALKHASIETMGEYNHHNTAMQTVRFVIDDLVPGHGFAHTLMDFNNAATTSHAGILRVLELARERILADLAKSRLPSRRDRD